MPVISEFYGIKIVMYYKGEHNPPHFHAWYAGKDVSVNIETGEISQGKISKRCAKMLKEWCDEHRQELKQNWEKARSRQVLSLIEPLD